MKEEKSSQIIGVESPSEAHCVFYYIKRVMFSSVKRVPWGMWIAGAVCFGLILFTIMLFNNNRGTDASSAVLPPGIIIESVQFIKSSWYTDLNECPDGFEYGGTIESTTETGKDLHGCKYYVNTNFPEWVYVYCRTWDESNHPYMAYVRFVLPEIRHNTFIRYNGQEYVKLWFVDERADQKALYDYQLELINCYGFQIEISVPDGGIFAGKAHFEESDRIPQTELGINHRDYEGSDVYAHPNDKRVLYIGTTWHTSTEEEAGETLHTGYDVFVLSEGSVRSLTSCNNYTSGK